MIKEPLPKNRKYWTVASWTQQGMQPWPVTWTDHAVDFMRLKEGRAFASKAEAEAYLREREELVA